MEYAVPPAGSVSILIKYVPRLQSMVFIDPLIGVPLPIEILTRPFLLVVAVCASE
jgi:hypothetical protein